MLKYRMRLYEDILEDTIKKYHLMDYQEQVRRLHDKLYEEVQGIVAYKKLDIKKDRQILNTLYEQKFPMCEQGIIGMITLGYEFERLLQKYMNEPLSQHILDILGNVLLDEVLHAFKTDVLHLCGFKGLGQTYFPGSHLPLEMNQWIYQSLKEDLKDEVHVNDYHILSPMKTIAFISPEIAMPQKKREHHCQHCSSCHCPHRQRKVTLTVKSNGQIVSYSVPSSENLLKVLNEKGYVLSADCSGRGQCGKCRVQVITPLLPPQKIDKTFLTDKEIKEGIRCACAIELNEDLTIQLLHEKRFHKEVKLLGLGEKRDVYGIAIDVGTTTIEGALVSKTTGKTLMLIKEENKQKRFGRDVLTRAKFAGESRKNMTLIQTTILRQLQEMVLQMLDYTHLFEHQIQQIILSGNTVMSYILLGKSPSKMVVAPFELETKCFKPLTGEHLGLIPSIEVLLLPVISSFMGSDILSGMVYTKMSEINEPCLLIDLGTNGEMVLRHTEGYVGCSVAVGPAFEGTHISCGMSALEGAICSYENPHQYTVIGDKEAVGLCGSGMIDVIDYLLKAKLMDTTGLLKDIEKKEEKITDQLTITQQDIRQIQMAKSAIRTGIDILLKESHLTAEAIKKVYITGGFGEYFNSNKAIAIGLLHEIFEGKIETCHNTSLQGSIQGLLDKEVLKGYHNLSDAVNYLELANHPDFESLYINYMNFY